MFDIHTALDSVVDGVSTMRILLVDDDPVFRHIVQSWMSRCPYQCLIVPDIESAHQSLIDQSWDVVVADLNLGVDTGQGNGLDLIKKVNELDLPVACVLMTAYGEQHEFSNAVKLGIDRLLIKPVRRDEFLDMLSKLDHIRLTKYELSQARKALEDQHQLLLSWREREQRIAQMAQKYLLFSVPEEPLESLEMFAAARAQEGASGDLIDVCTHKHGIDLVMGDGMGKGLGAAIVSAGIKTSLAQVRQRSAESAIETLADSLRTQISPMLHEMESLLTLITARVDIHAGELSFIDFGAPYVLLQRASHGQVIFAHGDMLPLGVSHEELHVTQLPLHKGDKLLFISDGILDAMGLPDARQAYAHLARDWIDSSGTIGGQDFVQSLANSAGQPNAHQDDKSCVLIQFLHENPAGRHVVHLDVAFELEGLASFRADLYASMQEWFRQAGHILETWFSEFVLGAVEILTNIIKHGFNADQPLSRIEVSLTMDIHGVWMEFFYKGLPFVPPSQRTVSEPKPELWSESGYGLFLINTIFDRVDFFTEMASSQAIAVYKKMTFNQRSY